MIKSALLRLANSLGYQVIRSRLSFSDEELTVMQKVKDYTGTSPERLQRKYLGVMHCEDEYFRY